MGVEDRGEARDQERTAAGEAAYHAVYGAEAPRPPRGTSLPVDTMMAQLFAEVWARDGLAVRDRRLLVIGVLAAQGQHDKVELQLRRALREGELSLDEAEEAVLQLCHYVGWGLASPLMNLVADVRAEDAP